MSRIHQLNQTISELRIRGLAERMEIRTLRAEKAELLRQIAELHDQVAELATYVRNSATETQTRTPFVVGSVPVCNTAAQYESLSIERAGMKL